MVQFTFGKDVGDIEEPALLSEDWYKMRITQEPSLEPNKKMQEGLEESEGAGHNLIIRLVITEEDEEANGRMFTAYLPFPNQSDEKERDGRGMLKSDSKMQRITKAVEAFRGEIDGANVSLEKGSVGMGYVIQQMGLDGQTLVNSLDTFGQGFKKAEV